MENNSKRNIYYTFCHVIFFNLQKVLSDFFRRKFFQ
jgi:hypothetical protein